MVNGVCDTARLRLEVGLKTGVKPSSYGGDGRSVRFVPTVCFLVLSWCFGMQRYRTLHS